MTVFGWDSSHYDGPITATIAAAAKAQGIAFVTHKLSEGSGGLDTLAAQALTSFRDAGIEFIGAYGVVRTGDAVAEADVLISMADAQVPWWRDFPGWFWQTDLEKWPYDPVPATLGITYSRELAARTGKLVVLYGSAGQYGSELSSWEGPLWNAHYGLNQPGLFQVIYPGDQSAGWAAYSGKTPTFLQYSSAATIAGLTTCDANAFRGTVAQLRALITGTPTPQEDPMMIATDGKAYYLCDGMRSRPIDAKQIPDLKYLAAQGLFTLAHGPGNNAEWTANGTVRLGWTEANMGPVDQPAAGSPAPVPVALNVTLTGTATPAP